MALELRTEYPLDYKGCDGARPLLRRSPLDFMRFFP